MDFTVARAYGKMKRQDAQLASNVFRSFLTYYVTQLMDAAAGKDAEYKDMIDCLDRKIKGLENDIKTSLLI